MWKKIKKNYLVKQLASFDVTIICLILLMILTFWGTLHQVDYGLYDAQHRMFNTWFFTFLGFIPFPGAKLVLWVAFINLGLATIFKHSYQWKKIGLLLTHFGLLLLIISAGFTYHFAEESSLTLEEGEASNVSDDYHHWEFAIWKQSVRGDSVFRDGEAFPLNAVGKGETLSFLKIGLPVKITEVYKNCKAMTGPTKPGMAPNGFNINELISSRVSTDPAENYPGLIFDPLTAGSEKMIVYGGAPTATSMTWEGENYYVALRRKKHPLPVSIQLNDFKKSEYPGTQKARSFESKVTIGHQGIERDITISMNKPFRQDGFTFYQASFSQAGGQEASTLAVVKNYGRLLPYISCLLVGLGLIVHFVLRLVAFAANQKRSRLHVSK